ncbi:hypothetical protein SynA1524_00448 [Synechococcus sp. A15-24]|nr:hypothetical protein SynA1524_00448 [Synechococcus sp. A15-24]
MPLFWCLIALWASNQVSRRWIASGYPPNPADDALSSAQASQSTKTFGLLTQADSSL